MNQYIKELNSFLKECEVRDGFSGIPSILDFLWECYSCVNPVDDGRIREKEDILQSVMNELSMQNSDALFNMIEELISAYQRAAFLEGIAVGTRLEKELSAPAPPVILSAGADEAEGSAHF